MKPLLDDPLYDPQLSIKEHINRAQRHTEAALDMCYRSPGRPFFFRIALAKAQSLLIKLYLKEIKTDS